MDDTAPDRSAVAHGTIGDARRHRDQRTARDVGHPAILDVGMGDAASDRDRVGGLLDTLQRDPKALGQRVCFIHTGGIFSLFPLREPLTRLLDS